MGKTHIAMVPCPGVGHRAPMLELAKLLASHGFLLTLLLIDEEKEEKKEDGHDNIEEEEGAVRVVSMKLEVSKGGDGCSGVKSLFMALDQLGPSMLDLLRRLQPPLDCVIVDSMLPTTVHLGIPVIGFCTHMTAAFSIFCCLPSLQLPSNGVIKEVKEINSFPGIRPISTKELPWFSTDDDEMEYFHGILIRVAKNLKGEEAMKWLLCNSIYELERPAMDALMDAGVPVLPIGPLFLTSLGADKRANDNDKRSNGGNNPSVCPWLEDHTCLEWLDEQSQGSVVFVSFGSIAIFDVEQLREIALGLEASGRPILWVLCPGLVNKDDANAAILPEGFLERTKGRCNLVPWVSQKSVLGHLAVGAFLTHCGWNSTMESIAMGVPLLAWPYFEDQPFNSCYVALEWKVGLTFCSKLGEAVVGRGEVEGMIRRLMETEEGNEIRERCHAWRNVVASAVQEGGSSHASFHKFIHYLKTLSHGQVGLES